MKPTILLLLSFAVFSGCTPPTSNTATVNEHGQTLSELNIYYNTHATERHAKKAECDKTFPQGGPSSPVDCQAARMSSFGNGD